MKKYKVLLGTSLLVLTSACQNQKKDNAEERLCYAPLPLEDSVEVRTQDTLVMSSPSPPPPPPPPTSSVTCYVPVLVDEDVICDMGIDVIDEDDEVMCYDIGVFTCPDVMPKFPGGDYALMMYIAKNLRYPRAALDSSICGSVSVTFVVMPDGSVDSVQIRKSPDPVFNEEALRVIREMPEWTPGTCKGKPVETKYTVPVRFRLPH